MTPAEALKSATISPATFFNLEDQLGTIEPEKYADLVILNSNPLEGINNVSDIHAVIQNGKYFSRQSLDSLLERAKIEISK